jgi:hypothetical protein
MFFIFLLNHCLFYCNDLFFANEIMGKTKETEKALLKALEKTPRSRRELKGLLGEKHVKSALKKLCGRGDIKKEGKQYVRVVTSQDQNGTAQQKKSPVSRSIPQIKSVPIAMQMRKDSSKEQSKSVRIVEPEVDIDEEIRRLEQELENSSSSEGSDSEDDDGESSYPVVLSLSKFAKDRIEQLPGTCLPEPGRYNKKDGMRMSLVSKKKKAEIEVSNGLREAVKEVLNGYKARSSEKLPFYCRVCAKQYDNETDFFNHKSTQFHKTAVEMEKKASFCKLCRKQLTSPEQMKEHLKSRPHKERLQKMRDRQGGRGQQQINRRQWK